MMKTEQELKDALEDIFFDALTDTSNPPYYTDKVDPENDGYWQCKVYELCADELIKRGYGDVSEYKAEIERLKSDNEALTMWNEAYTEENEKLKEENKKLEEDIDMIIKEQKDDCKFDIKQAKIDVLNTARERCDLVAEELEDEIDHYGSSAAYSCAYEIKKLIKEIEEQ